MPKRLRKYTDLEILIAVVVVVFFVVMMILMSNQIRRSLQGDILNINIHTDSPQVQVEVTGRNVIVNSRTKSAWANE